MSASERTLFARERGAVRYVAGAIWLVFVVFPIAAAFGNDAPMPEKVLNILAATAFVIVYVLVIITWRRHGTTRVTVALTGIDIVLACLLTVVDRPGWGFLFTYCVAVSSLVAPWGMPLIGLTVCTVLAGVMTTLGGGNGGMAVGYVSSTAGIGLLMVLMRDLRLRNTELTQARAEIARLAVAQERERFARDLHDLLGHSLSVIALKAELAGRLLPAQPADAAREVGELELVARSALSDVREAVSGYRRPTLEGELAGARMALSAAGIEVDVTGAEVPLTPEVEAVLAWSVREGATNVIRHSGARRCSVRVMASETDASVEVVDDGRAVADGNGGGLAAAEDGTGNGLAGIAARVRLLHGSVDAGRENGGGFRLRVTVPVSDAIGGA